MWNILARPVKDHTTPSENGDVPSPKSKILSKNVHHRGRADGESSPASAACETDDLPKVTHEPKNVSKPLSRAAREGCVISFPTRLKIMNHYLMIVWRPLSDLIRD
ncbi:hypothetical protein P7K49_025743 [Saguinus oedipus]|uniref:Uncharacterized protein n=1 Tax=Saguinus oedipus TaxID=9490 RepID=A0ABQ9UI14_SAGOE|nr:hypothetical protein P7K49_025743 [Saguinus oedipus]